MNSEKKIKEAIAEQSLMLYRSMLDAINDYKEHTDGLFASQEEWMKQAELVFSGYASAITEILSQVTVFQSQTMGYDKEMHVLSLNSFLKCLKKELLARYDEELEILKDK